MLSDGCPGTVSRGPVPAPPTPPAAPSGRFTTLPVGAALPSGAECAARVRRAAEIRPENAAANANAAPAPTPTHAPTGHNSTCRRQLHRHHRRDHPMGRMQMGHRRRHRPRPSDQRVLLVPVRQRRQRRIMGPRPSPRHRPPIRLPVPGQRSHLLGLQPRLHLRLWRACYEGVYTWLNTVDAGPTTPVTFGAVLGCGSAGRWYVSNDAYLNQTATASSWNYNNKTWTTTTFING